MNGFVDRMLRRVAAMGVLGLGFALESPAAGQEIEAADQGLDVPVVQINVGQVVRINVGPADQAAALKQQYPQRMRPLLQTELDFIRRICPPAPIGGEKSESPAMRRWNKPPSGWPRPPCGE